MKKWWAIFFVAYLIVLAFIDSLQTRLIIAAFVGAGILVHDLYIRRTP